jgi:hypothetical protein
LLTRDEGLRATSPSCRCCCAERRRPVLMSAIGTKRHRLVPMNCAGTPIRSSFRPATAKERSRYTVWPILNLCISTSAAASLEFMALVCGRDVAIYFLQRLLSSLTRFLP